MKIADGAQEEPTSHMDKRLSVDDVFELEENVESEAFRAADKHKGSGIKNQTQ